MHILLYVQCSTPLSIALFTFLKTLFLFNIVNAIIKRFENYYVEVSRTHHVGPWSELVRIGPERSEKS